MKRVLPRNKSQAHFDVPRIYYTVPHLLVDFRVLPLVVWRKIAVGPFSPHEKTGMKQSNDIL